MKPPVAFVFLSLVFLPAIAFAHAGDHSLGSWGAGLLHPLTGVDHLLALMAAGIWLDQQASGHRRTLMVAFFSLLLFGMVFGLRFPGASFEPGIVATLIVLGALVACAARLPLWLTTLILSVVAAIHGFTHGAEMTDHSGAAMSFGLGLLLSSALLLLLSAAVAGYARSRASAVSTKVVGFAIFLWGLVLTFSFS